MDNFIEYGWEDEIVNEGGDFVLLPEGDYDFTVTKVERARHNGSEKVPPCNMAKVTFTIWGAVMGKKGKCHVYVDNYKNKNGEDRQSNKIKKLYAYDENVTTVQPAKQTQPAPQQYSQPAQTGGWKAGAF